MELDRTDPLWPVLDLVPGWSGAIRSVTVLPGGITNRSYRVKTSTGEFVVRVPGAQTELLGIDRRAEAMITVIASRLDVAPAVLCEIATFGTVVSDFVEARTLDPHDIAAPEVLNTVLDMLRTLHSCAPVAHTFPIFEIVRRHESDARLRGRLHPDVPKLLGLIERIEATVPEASLTSTLCHNDLLPANLLLAPNGRVWLIDYEYAGMNHVMFDLANLSVNAALDLAADELMLTKYFGAMTKRNHAQLQLFKIVSELREGLWALVQSAISTTAGIDFVAYAASRLTNCARLSEAEGVGRWLIEAKI